MFLYNDQNINICRDLELLVVLHGDNIHSSSYYILHNYQQPKYKVSLLSNLLQAYIVKK